MQKRNINSIRHGLTVDNECAISFCKKSILLPCIMIFCIITFLFLEEVHAQSASNITETSADVSGGCGSVMIGNTEVKYSGILWLPNGSTAVPAGGSVTAPLSGLQPGASYSIGLTCHCDSGQPITLCHYMCVNFTWGCGWSGDNTFRTKNCTNDATKACETDDGCPGSQKCINEEWGSCIRRDPCCPGGGSGDGSGGQ